MTVEKNSLGLPQAYGVTIPDEGWGYNLNRYGSKRELVIPFSYDSLPETDSDYEMIPKIPAGSFIESSRVFVKTAFAGGTSYNFGLVRSDDGTTAIDADGLDAAVATAALSANAVVDGNGALVGAVSDATEEAVVAIAPTGTFTAGEAVLIITYIPPQEV